MRSTSGKTYHVVPAGDEWEVYKHVDRLGVFATRDEAVDFVRQRSRHDRHARVVLHSYGPDLEQEVAIGQDTGEHGDIPWVMR